VKVLRAAGSEGGYHQRVEEFRATVESARGGGHLVPVPDDVAAALNLKHMMRVKGSLDGSPYRSNVAKMSGRLILGIHKATLAAAGRDTGDTVTITMAQDPEPREKDAGNA
jgi:hypothetical protein